MSQTKLHTLKRRAIADGSRLAIVLLMFLGVYSGFSAYVSGLEEEKRTMQAAIRKLEREAQQLDQQYAKARESVAIYEQMTNETDSADPLNREAVSEVLIDLKKRHRIGTLDLSITSLQRITREEYRIGDIGLVYAVVTLKFTGLTDAALLSFVDSVKSEFTGYVSISQLILERRGEVTEDVLRQVRLGKTPELVNGQIIFHWLAMEDVGKREGGGT